MSFVRFKKVNNEVNLPSEIIDGSIYLVKDTSKIFADFDGTRQAFSISQEDIAGYVQDSLEESLEDFRNSLDSIEATLDEDVEDNYTELKNNLRTIGQYSKTTEIESMIDEATNKVAFMYGTVDAGTIKLNKNYGYYVVDTSEYSNISLDTTALASNIDVIQFNVIVKNGDVNIPNFTFNPITLDTPATIEYNYSNVMLDFRGIKKFGGYTWTVRSMGGWN